MSFQKSSATKSTVSGCLQTPARCRRLRKVHLTLRRAGVPARGTRTCLRHSRRDLLARKHFSGGWGRNLLKTHERRGRRRRTSFSTIVSRFATAPSRCRARDARGKRPPSRHRLAKESDLPVEHGDLLSCGILRAPQPHRELAGRRADAGAASWRASLAVAGLW